MPNGPVLGVDTSGPYCAAAIWMDGAVIAESREDMARGQVERLAPFIEALLSDARITWADLAALGVSVGPGNFTGIRISLSFVRGLALGLDIPAVGVSALESLADTLPDEAPTLLCFAPPGRTAHLVQAWADGAATSPPHAWTPGEPMPDLPYASRVAGEGADILAGALNIAALPLPNPANPAASIAKRAARRIAQGGPVAPPRPLYARPADAAPPRDALPVLID